MTPKSEQKVSDPFSRDAFSRNSIRDALKRFHNASQLAEHPLAALSFIIVDGPAMHRGLLLRDALRAGIESLRPQHNPSGSPDFGEKRWRPYIILSEQYLANRKPDYLADALGLVRGTFHQEQARALELLGNHLREREAQAPSTKPAANNDMTLVLASAAPFLAPSRPAHRLVGRDGVLSALKQHLIAGHSVALQGLPGAGKTALAIELANDPDLRERFCDGVLWIGLGRGHSQSSGPDTLALLSVWMNALIEAHDPAPNIREAARFIHTAIGNRRVLLVMDDAWASEPALAFKLGGPQCAHLLTTRLPAVAIDFAGAYVIKVNELDAAASAQLLQQHVPNLQPANLQTLSTASGGLPLSLTLMGRFLRKASHAGQPRRLQQALQQLAQRDARLNLSQPDELLARRPGWDDDTPLSLLNVIRNSEEMLSEEARLVWQALALFEPKPNSFSEEAALAVCARTNVNVDDSVDPVDADLSALDELVDAGLVEVDASGRYALHQTICDYARSRPRPLSRGERGAEHPSPPGRGAGGEGRMTAYYANFMQQHRTHYTLIETETTNILRALELAHQHEHQHDLIRMAIAFYTFASTRGLYDTIAVHLNRALTAAQSIEHQSLLPGVLLNLGWLARKRGEARKALALFEQGFAHAEAANDSESQSALLLGLATVCNDLSEHQRAREFGQRGLALADTTAGNREITTMLLIELALISSHINQAEAYDFLMESVKLARETGDQRLMSTALAGMGITSFWKGECDEGERYLREGMALSQAIGFTEMHGLTLALQAWVDANRGDYERADMLAEESLRITQVVQFTEAIFAAHLAQGTADLHRGKLAEAEQHLQEGLRLARQVDQRESMGWLLGMLARVAMQAGDWVRAEQTAQEGLQVARSAQHAEMMSPLLAVLGQIAAHENKHAEAARNFDEAMQHARATQFPWLVCYTQHARGEWLLMQGELAKAQSAFEEARSIAEKLGAKELLSKAMQGIKTISGKN